jgi:hypothetical protein
MDFNRFDTHMKHKTPEGHLARKQANMSPIELSAQYSPMVLRDMEMQSAFSPEQWARLNTRIAGDAASLSDDTKADRVASDIARDCKVADQKGFDENEAGAYVIALAREIARRPKNSLN